ncbi:MAG: hypothetical protein GYA15_03635 [Leptolinea sp.]|jgi:hypothetical protein|nr:hypothetical protein [Leptolinea sp.]
MTGKGGTATLLLNSLCAHGQVNQTESLTRLMIPAGGKSAYRIAQLDDYSNLNRVIFRYHPPVSFSLQSRVSAAELPGTWGFGLWNDPFALGLGVKGSGWRFPTLPQTAWFFYGSSKNDLSFFSEAATNGFTASVFSSRERQILFWLLAILGIPLIPIKPAARRMRRFAARFIMDTSQCLQIDPTLWHEYQINWLPDSVDFKIDGISVQSCQISPRPPLGLVIWIDNQYAAFSADGSIGFGLEANPEPAWLEIRNVRIG